MKTVISCEVARIKSGTTPLFFCETKSMTLLVKQQQQQQSKNNNKSLRIERKQLCKHFIVHQKKILQKNFLLAFQFMQKYLVSVKRDKVLR